MDRIKIIRNYVRPEGVGHISYEITNSDLITKFLKLKTNKYEQYVNESLLPVAEEIERIGSVEDDKADIDTEIWVIKEDEEELKYCYYKEYKQ